MNEPRGRTSRKNTLVIPRKRRRARSYPSVEEVTWPWLDWATVDIVSGVEVVRDRPRGLRPDSRTPSVHIPNVSRASLSRETMYTSVSSISEPRSISLIKVSQYHAGLTVSSWACSLIVAEGCEEGQRPTEYGIHNMDCLVSGRSWSGPLPTLHVADDERST